MKKVVFWILISALIMLILPWLAVSFVKGDNGMAVCFILFYLGNPIYSILAGVYAGKDRKDKKDEDTIYYKGKGRRDHQGDPYTISHLR